MAADQKFLLEIDADTKAAIQAIGKFVKESQEGIRKVEKSVNSLEKSAIAAFAVFAGTVALKAAAAAFRVIRDNIGDVVNEAIQAENAINALNTALALSGKFSKSTSAELQAYANELQRTTTLSDEQVLSSLTLIQNLARLEKDGLKRATSAAADLSAALGIDLQSASQLVGKAAEGNITAFQRYGIQVRKGATDTETFANTLSTLEGRFGGASKALANTFGGAVTQLNNKISDFKEELGNLIIQNPLIVEGVKLLGQAFDRLKIFVEENRAVFIELVNKVFVGLAKSLPIIIGLFNDLVFATRLLGQTASTVSKSVGGLAAIITTFAKGTLGNSKDLRKNLLAVSNVVADDLTKSFEDFNATTKKTDKIFDNVKNVAVDFGKAVERAAKNKIEITPKITVNQQEVDKFIDDLQERIEATSNSPTLRTTLSLLADNKTFQDTARYVNDLSKSQKQIALTGLEITSQSLKGAQGAVDLIAGVIGGIANVFLPGAGAFISDIIKTLSSGPEKVRALVTEFINSIPVIIENIILAIPAAIQAFVDAAPRFVEALVQAIPRIIESLISLLPRLITSIITLLPRVAVSFVAAIIQEVPDLIGALAEEMLKIPGRFAEELLKSIGLGGGGGGGGGGIVGAITKPFKAVGKVFGFEDGGRIPDSPRYNNDGFGPAALSAGEQVLNKDLTRDLERFLAGEGGTQNVTVNLMLGEQQLASTMLSLKRQGFRLA